MNNQTREGRLGIANAFIRIVSDHGRRFFYDPGTGKVDRLELDVRGRIWFLQRWNGRRIYTHYRYAWRLFTHGGTLKQLVESLRDYIMGRAPLPTRHLGPWPDSVCGGDPWGYGAQMKIVRRRVDYLEKAND